jgi:hypothetical protein
MLWCRDKHVSGNRADQPKRDRRVSHLLFAKHFGHTMARWTAGRYPEDFGRLAQAADRLGESDQRAAALLRQALPFAVAFTGRAPSQLSAKTSMRSTSA